MQRERAQGMLVFCLLIIHAWDMRNYSCRTYPHCCENGKARNEGEGGVRNSNDACVGEGWLILLAVRAICRHGSEGDAEAEEYLRDGARPYFRLVDEYLSSFDQY